MHLVGNGIAIERLRLSCSANAKAISPLNRSAARSAEMLVVPLTGLEPVTPSLRRLGKSAKSASYISDL
jgi:hypothetical protein